MLGAYITDTVPEVIRKEPLDAKPSQILSNLLCNPEWQLLVIVITLAITGGGRLSLDSFIF